MDLKKTILICAAVCLFCCVSPALADSPSHVSTNVGTFTLLAQNGGYGVMALPITDTISQGQTKTHYYSIPKNAETLSVCLEWNMGMSDNNLSLEMSDMSNSYGPFYDLDDGRDDNVILIVTSSFKKGCMWSFEVNGEQVLGTQMFNLIINAV